MGKRLWLDDCRKMPSDYDLWAKTADEAIDILSKVYAPLPPKEVGIMVKDLVAAKFWSEGRLEMPLLQNTVHAMKGVGMLDSDVDLTKIVDSSLLPADLQK